FFGWELFGGRFVLINGSAGGKIFEFKELAKFDDAVLRCAMRSRDALGPGNGFVAGLDVDDPVAGDEFLGFSEGAVNDRDFAIAGRKVDARSFGAGLEAGEVNENAGLH